MRVPELLENLVAIMILAAPVLAMGVWVVGFFLTGGTHWLALALYALSSLACSGLLLYYFLDEHIRKLKRKKMQAAVDSEEEA